MSPICSGSPVAGSWGHENCRRAGSSASMSSAAAAWGSARDMLLRLPQLGRDVLAQLPVDAAGEVAERAAADRRVVERPAVPAVGQVAAAGDVDELAVVVALGAGLLELLEPEVGGDLVERRVEDEDRVLGESAAADSGYVADPYGAVGLDDAQAAQVAPERVEHGRHPHEAADHHLEGADLRRILAEPVPLLERFDQEPPVGLGSLPPLGQVGVVAVGQQEVERVEALVHEPAHQGGGVGLRVDHAEDARVDAVEARPPCAEPADDAELLLVRAAAVVPDALLARDLGRAVEAEAERDPVSLEQLQPFL